MHNAHLPASILRGEYAVRSSHDNPRDHENVSNCDEVTLFRQKKDRNSCRKLSSRHESDIGSQQCSVMLLWNRDSKCLAERDWV